MGITGTFSDWESDSDDSDDDFLENLATIELSVDCPIVEDGQSEGIHPMTRSSFAHQLIFLMFRGNIRVSNR